MEIIRDSSVSYVGQTVRDGIENFVSEMTDNQQLFLCGLIRDKKPKKILEIGVAEGGTTAIILKELSEIEGEHTVYSVDLCENYYRDSSRKTGYILEGKEDLFGNNIKHEFLLGKCFAEQINKIGEKIDFVILDTIHSLPGEMLDFLALFPFLADNAIVVFHDVMLGLLKNSQQIATSVLINCLVGKKYWRIDNDIEDANIAAIEITDETKSNIENVITSLSIPWEYYPTEKELNVYEELYKKHYSKKHYELIQHMIHYQLYRINNLKDDAFESLLKNANRVFIYGAGIWGKRLEKELQNRKISIEKFVVTNKTKDDERVIDCEEYLEKYNDTKDVLLYAIDDDKKYYYYLEMNGIHCISVPDLYFRKR